MNYQENDWQVRLTARVGAKGTLAEYKQYGDSLVCVRYRYNKKLKRRIKTVEIVVDERPWKPESGSMDE